MSAEVPRPIRRARQITGLILLLTSTLVVAGSIGWGYRSTPRPTVVGPLGTAAPGANAQMPGGFIGHWRGEVSQTGYGIWVADIELQGGTTNSVVGSGTYPILECSGTLTLLRVEPGSIDVMVTMTQRGAGATCLTRHFATLEPARDGSLVYRESEDSAIDFHGVLVRQP